MNIFFSVRSILLLVFVFQSVVIKAQSDSAYLKYIARFSNAAIAEMYYSRVPASITMAQALHESRYGTSELAVNANNHFGIKCQKEWTGDRYTYQDDDSNNCFRKYDSVQLSYRDHSDFLMTRPRYSFLFQLDPLDYVGWAHGLKQAGYATNPNYGKILVKIIEDYKLFLLDVKEPAVEPMNSVSDVSIPHNIAQAAPPESKVFHRNRIDFMIVRPGDNIKSLTRKLDLLNWEIRKYNEIPKNEDIRPGQVIYLQPKRRSAEAGYSIHTVEPGQTMYTISQLYGVKLKWLYKRNRLKEGTPLKVGQEIWLRGMKPSQR
jgi:hypothetical protein